MVGVVVGDRVVVGVNVGLVVGEAVGLVGVVVGAGEVGEVVGVVVAGAKVAQSARCASDTMSTVAISHARLHMLECPLLAPSRI